MLSASELLEFLEDQGEHKATLAHAQQLIHTYELNETGEEGSDRSGCPAKWALLFLTVGAILGSSPHLFETQPPSL